MKGVNLYFCLFFYKKIRLEDLLKISTICIFFDYRTVMEEIYSTTSVVSPLTVILWCFYPIAILVLIELFLGGGFDDDNDDQDGGMMIPAYSRTSN